MTETLPPRQRLRDRLAGDFAVVVELVPWRGALGERAGERARALADALRGDPRFDAVSITDGAGGHAMLSPEILARDLAEHGQQTIVHVACRDRNRNEILSLGWRLATAGIENVLAVSGDYPVEGYLGVARPVFDLDSVTLLDLYTDLNEGRIAEDVLGRPIARDSTAHMADLGPVRGGGQPPASTDFFLGVAVSPFKRHERDLIPQYLKLELKVRTGAHFAITQVGYDARKFDELQRYVEMRGLRIPILANVFILRPGSARVLHGGEVPGVTVTDELLALVERHAASLDKGAAFCLELAAKQVAIARGLGYAGVYLGGTTRYEDYGRVLEMAASYGPDDWRSFVRDIAFSPPDTFWFFEDDPASGLNGPAPRARPRDGNGRFGGAPLGYRASRVVHELAFAPDSVGFRLAGRAYATAERLHLGHPMHVLEQAIKAPLFDCRDCGDCSLPELAYLCPESQCAKNQRNGPCGGSHDGECEIPGKACLWARAYERLRPYGEELSMLDRPVAVADNSLRRTSAWASTFLGRDHLARSRAGAAGHEAVAEKVRPGFP